MLQVSLGQQEGVDNNTMIEILYWNQPWTHLHPYYTIIVLYFVSGPLAVSAPTQTDVFRSYRKLRDCNFVNHNINSNSQLSVTSRLKVQNVQLNSDYYCKFVLDRI